jgi:hypothetical protein
MIGYAEVVGGPHEAVVDRRSGKMPACQHTDMMRGMAAKGFRTAIGDGRARLCHGPWTQMGQAIITAQKLRWTKCRHGFREGFNAPP